VIVVDDGSHPPIGLMVSLFSQKIDVKLVTQNHAGPSKARNTGAAKAKGNFLVFTDDDCVPVPDWLQKLSMGFTEFSNHMIGGKTLNALPNNIYSSVSQLIIDAVYSYYNVFPNRPSYFTSNNIALPSEAFYAIGGFNDTFMFAEDREFCDQWLRHGYQMTQFPEVVLYHAHVLTLLTFWRQHFNYGRGAYRYHHARAQRGAGPFRPDLKFYFRLFSYPLSQVRGLRLLWLSILLLISQISNTVGFFWEMGRQLIRENDQIHSSRPHD
jgi:glycosyltransferase involved in cell wall biosynthesis